MSAWFAVIVDGRLDGESLCETRAEADAYFAQWCFENPAARQCIVDVRVVDIFEKPATVEQRELLPRGEAVTL